jgi:hypothetical protein
MDDRRRLSSGALSAVRDHHLRESIVRNGTTFGRLTPYVTQAAALSWRSSRAVRCGGSTSTAGARAGSEAISSADDAGRLGLWAYTYFHLPLIAGIVVVAVGRRACGQPPGCRRDDNHNRGDPGGITLHLAGHALYKWALSHHLTRSRLLVLPVRGYACFAE